MSRLLKSWHYLIKCLGLALLLGFISFATIGGCNNDGSIVDTFLGVQQTGQTVSYADGDDGELQSGVVPPELRFTDNGNATVFDNFTECLWSKDASCLEPATWEETLEGVGAVADGICGLTDGSNPGDWRVANIRELQTLVDYSTTEPALPSGHPFVGIGSDTVLWSSTTFDGDPDFAYALDLNTGEVIILNKSEKAGCMFVLKN